MEFIAFRDTEPKRKEEVAGRLELLLLDQVYKVQCLLIYISKQVNGSKPSPSKQSFA